MHMFGHDHVSDELEAVLCADLVENFDKAVSRASSSEKGLPAIATESHKMEITASVKSLQTIAH